MHRTLKAEELFYQISSDLIRLFPVKIPTKKVTIDNVEIELKDYENAKVKQDASILLLKQHIPFLTDKYNMLLTNICFVKAMDVILRVEDTNKRW